MAVATEKKGYRKAHDKMTRDFVQAGWSHDKAQQKSAKIFRRIDKKNPKVGK